MNEAHLHLLVNHAPVFASIFTALLLVWALLRRSPSLMRVALAGAVITGLLTLPAYFTGEPAEHKIRREAGFERKIAHEHEEAGEFGLISGSITGVLGLALLLAFRRRDPKTGWMVLMLVVNLWAVSVFARVAYLGGQIRHPEARAGWTPVARDSTAAPTGD